MGSYRPRSIWKIVMTDILLGALILGVTVFFELGLPILRARMTPAPTALPVVAAPSATPAPTATPAPEESNPAPVETAMPELAGTPETTPEPTEDPRTAWQIKFAEHFSEETVITDHSYTSPQVSIQLETREFGEGDRKSVYHVADIYVASLDNFRTYTANNELRYFSTQDAMEMDAASHAILAISGDFYSYQPKGFLMRNGQLYMSDQTYCDLCVLYTDGTMAVYGREDYTVQEILDRGIVQAWNFGPSLLDENGLVKPDYELSTAVSYPNPRSAVGYYEPGHYCFVVVDGRQDGYSYGMTVPELARVFQDLGCKVAYNLDGGGSALMTFLHERYSRQSNGAGRELGDILLITEDGWEEKR